MPYALHVVQFSDACNHVVLYSICMNTNLFSVGFARDEQLHSRSRCSYGALATVSNMHTVLYSPILYSVTICIAKCGY